MTNKAFSALPATTSGALDYSATYMHVFDTSDKKLPLGELFAGVWGNSLRVTADGAAAGGAVISGYGFGVYGSQVIRGNSTTTAGTVDHQNSAGTVAASVTVDPATGEYKISLDPNGTIGAGRMGIYVGGTEVARFTTNGDVRVGSVTTDNPASSNVDGARISAVGNASVSSEEIAINANVTDTEARGIGQVLRARYQGDVVGAVVVTSSGTAYNTTSDYRLKAGDDLITGALARVLSLPARRFGWVNNPDAPVVDGFFAHEAALVVPESVTGEKDAVGIDPETGHEVPVYQQIDQAKLVPVLWAAVQDLAGQVGALEARIEALEAGAP